MIPLLRTGIVLAALMFAATALAVLMRPTHRLGAASGNQPQLEQAIPTAFAQWELDTSVVPLPPSPEIERRLDLYYDQALGRTYRNKVSGEQIMLAIAYGREQSREFQVHRPEVCYAAQGFWIDGLKKDWLRMPDRADLPVMRLIGTKGIRTEPITYWIRFGKDVVRGNLEQGYSRLAHGLRGDIPDALLFRVSTIGTEPDQAYPAHDRFARDLIASLDANTRHFLIAERWSQTRHR